MKDEKINKQLLNDLDGEFSEVMPEPIGHAGVMGEVEAYYGLGKTVASVTATNGELFPIYKDIMEILNVLPEPSPALTGADIITIRTLTGKKRDNAIAALNQLTVEMLANASPECFYIPGNTASSKNNKEIGFYLKKNPATGVNDKVNILMDSKRTTAYKKNTAGYWLQNKVAFLNQTRHLPIPLSIEFTFIRESLRRFDAINALQAVADLMSANGWIPDDETCYFHPVFNKQTFYHKDMAGVLIRVIK